MKVVDVLHRVVRGWATLPGGIRALSDKLQTVADLQRAQLIMQREQSEAMVELTATVKRMAEAHKAGGGTSGASEPTPNKSTSG